MYIKIKTFNNPFSFFCIPEQADNSDADTPNTNQNTEGHFRSDVTKLVQDQYVAVLVNQKWLRGVVSKEQQFLIWLVDVGVYIRPNDKTVCVDLSLEYKNIPSKVFEAGIHGAMPVDKTLNDQCEIEDVISTKWNPAAIEHVKKILETAIRVHFIPVAMMSTDSNDIVLGDLFVKTPKDGFVNIVDVLERWPIYLQRNKEVFISNLAECYRTRRHHRACLLKPDFPSLPTMRIDTSLEAYSAICERAPKFEPPAELEPPPLDGDGVPLALKSQILTPEEIEQYAHMYVEICGREYNVLNVMLNKMRDLEMCELYKDDDLLEADYSGEE